MHTLRRDALCAAIRGPVTIQAMQGNLPGLARHIHAPLGRSPRQGRLARLRAIVLPPPQVTAYGGPRPLDRSAPAGPQVQVMTGQGCLFLGRIFMLLM